MRRLAEGSVRAANSRHAGAATPTVVRTAAIALATAGAVALTGGAGAFWLCLPGVLLACASTRTRAGAVLSATAVVAAAAAPILFVMPSGSRPSMPLALLVVVSSAAVLVGVRERLEREREVLREFALRDPLTGIANRRSLVSRAEYEIARHTRARSRFAVVMLDLDGFKPLNDRFGHAAGDDLLRDVATAVQRALRAPDTVARLGGDEFCVLAPETDEHGAAQLAARIEAAVMSVSAGVEALHASLGIAVFPTDGKGVAVLLQTADQRLLAAKRERHRSLARRRAA